MDSSSLSDHLSNLISLFPTESSPKNYLVRGLTETKSLGEESYAWQGGCRFLTNQYGGNFWLFDKLCKSCFSKIEVLMLS